MMSVMALSTQGKKVFKGVGSPVGTVHEVVRVQGVSVFAVSTGPVVTYEYEFIYRIHLLAFLC